MPTILPTEFFQGPATDIARKLLGKFLIRSYEGSEWALLITEVELYEAKKGQRAGTLHIHRRDEAEHLLHIATSHRDEPIMILLRGALVMLPTGEIEHIKDPAQLTRFLRITDVFDGQVAVAESDIWFEDRDITIPHAHIIERTHTDAQEKDVPAAPRNFSIEIVRNGEME